MNFYVDLFLTFAKVGVCTFGGGYAMLPILQREVVEKKHWVTDEAITDYYALGQCTPGIIAVNTSVFIGHQLRKIPGGIVAALGVVFPSFVVITIIAAFLANFSDYPAVQHALAGINAVVVALILSSVLKLGKTTLKNAPSLCVFLGVLVLGELAGLLDLPADSAAGSVLNLLANPAVLLVACIGVFAGGEIARQNEIREAQEAAEQARQRADDLHRQSQEIQEALENARRALESYYGS